MILVGKKIHFQDSCRGIQRQKENVETAKGQDILCARIRVHMCGGCEQNGVRNKTERSGIEGETEHTAANEREARADCGRGAACLLAHLSVLNLYVVSATGSAPAIPPGPIGGAPPRRRKAENPRRAPAPERDEKDELGAVGRARAREKERERERERDAFAGAHRERYIFPGRVAVAKSSQESRTNRRP